MGSEQKHSEMDDSGFSRSQVEQIRIGAVFQTLGKDEIVNMDAGEL